MGAGHLVIWGIVLVVGTVIFVCWIGTLIVGFRGLRRKSRAMIAVGVAGILIPVSICMLVWFSSTPSRTFKKEFGLLPPADVKNLKLTGAWWNDAVFMRFEAPPATISALLDSKYQRVASFDFRGVGAEIPDWWRPAITETTQIYEKSNDSGDEYQDDSTLITDPSSGVSFYLGLHSE